MNKLVNYLDNNSNNHISNDFMKKFKINSKETADFYKSFSEKNFNSYNLDCYDNNYFNNKKIIKKYILTPKFNNLTEFINLIEKYENYENIEYNNQFEKLKNIKTQLINLNKLIGLDNLKNEILDQIIFYIQNINNLGNLSYFHTIIQGPPGTGKTEVAKIISEIFANLGILKSKSFKKVTRSDLIAGYLGQTAIKTKKVIEESIGGVLFIDEAYSLGNSEKRDSFAKECLDTLCESLSFYKSELMVIIAGYEDELNRCFFSFNTGLRSRFPWTFTIEKYNYNELYLIFKQKVNENKWFLHNDIDNLFFKNNFDLFPAYGRDIENFLNKVKIMYSRRVFMNNLENNNIIITVDLENALDLYKKHSLKKIEDKLPEHMYN